MTTDRDTVVHKRACHLCEAICGLEIKVRHGEIISIKGDPDDPLSRGHICPKAVALQDIHDDPNRLRGPMRRVSEDQWEPLSWNEAIKITARRIVEIREQHGPNALGVYLGNPSVHNYGILTHQMALFSLLRTQNRFSATSVDQLPHHLVSYWLYGHKDLLPVVDVDSTSYLLVLGANPLASNGSIWTVPDVRRRLRDMQARGGKLVVLDPRRSETAAIADEHHAIAPTTDMLFLSAMLNVLFTDNLVTESSMNAQVRGLDRVAQAISPFTPEAVEQTTGIDAATIRRLTHEFAASPTAACYGRMGVSVQSFGTLNHWLIQLINLVTGNFNRTGGTLFTHPAVNDFATTRPGSYDRFRSRVSQVPEFGGEIPAATLAEEILTPGEGQIRALFTCAGNPVLSTPNGRQLDRALDELEFMVSLDPYINETTRHADIVLPPTSPLEHDHYDLAFHSLAVRNTARFNEPVFDKPQDALHDWEIFCRLGEEVALLTGQTARTQVPPAEHIDKLLKAGHYSEAAGHNAKLDLSVLRENPSGVDLGALRPSEPERILTDGHLIHCDQAACLEDLERARSALTAKRDLTLIGRRHLRSNNSWMHNYHRLVKGKSRSALLAHPDDIAALGVSDGDSVKVSSAVGSVVTRIQSDTDMRPGVVSLPHGYGHDRTGVRLDIACEIEGASFNDLTDDKSRDPISGNAAVNGVAVEIMALSTADAGGRDAKTPTDVASAG